MRGFSLAGSLQLATSQALIGINMVILKCMITIFPMFFLFELRYLVGALVILAVMFLYKPEGSFKGHFGFSRKATGLLLLQATCVGFLFNYFMWQGVQSTSAIHVGIIASLLPLVVAVLAWAFLNERLTKNKMCALAIAVVSLVILHLRGATSIQTSYGWGDFFVLLAVIPEAAYTILAKHQSRQVRILPMLLVVHVVNAILFLPLCVEDLSGTHLSQFGAEQWGIVTWYILAGGLLSFGLWYRGLKHIPASTAALYTTFMPVTTVLLAALVLHESLGVWDLLAMAAILLAVTLGGRAASAPEISQPLSAEIPEPLRDDFVPVLGSADEELLAEVS